MKRQKLTNQITFKDEKDEQYEIKFFKLQSFLARNHPEVLDDYEQDERGNIVYG